MSRITHSMLGYFEKLPDKLHQHKIFVWLIFVSMTVFLVLGMGRAKFDMAIEGWFDKDDPTIVAFDQFHNEFGSEDHLFIVYKPKDGDVFSEESLQVALGIRNDLISRIENLPFDEESPLRNIVRITSLTNAPVLIAEGETLVSRDLVGKEIPSSEAELENIRAIAESQRKMKLMYFSDDYQYGGIFVETNFGAIPINQEQSLTNDEELELSSDWMDFEEHQSSQEAVKFKPTQVDEYISLMAEVKKTLNKPEFANHVEYYPVGNTATMEYNLETMIELALLNLAVIVIISILLWILFRSLSAMIWSLIIVTVSVIWVIGSAGWLGIPMTSFIMITVMLVLTIGVADTVHILSAYTVSKKEGCDHQAAIKSALRKSAIACLLTTVTTMVALLTLCLSFIVPIKIFGLLSALGVLFAFILSVYLLPLMLSIWSPKPPKDDRERRWTSKMIPNFSNGTTRVLQKVFPIVDKWRYSFIAVFICGFILCVYGATLTKVDTNPIGQFPEGSPIRTTFDVVDENMMGTQSLEVHIDLGEEYAFHDPFVLKVIDELQQKIETQFDPLVLRTTSIVDVVKDTYQTLNNSDPNYFVIPDTRQIVSQTLFMFNNANPEFRRRQVSDNYDKSHINIRFHNAGSSEYVQIFDRMKIDIDEALQSIKEKYPNATISITGMLALMMQGVDYLTHTQLESFGIALILISVILLIVFGSIKAGFIALIPNLIPAFLAFGLLGLLNIPLDFNTMMIAPIIIGIAVDDTVHFMTRYRNEVIQQGDIKKALTTTILETGHAVVFTTLILGLGFGVMAFSSSAGTANVGIFGSIAILSGLLNDLFLLPALILVFRLDYKHQRKHADPIEKTLSNNKLSQNTL